MEAFYEESSLARNAKRGGRKYKIWSYCSYISLFLGVIALFLAFFSIPTENRLTGEFIMAIVTAALFMGLWFVFNRLRSNCNISYDYCFVSGELRISRVVNINKRRLLAKFGVEDIVQIGDIDSPSFDRFFADPTSKNVFCTSNSEAADGKFFMYILAEYNGKKLFILECRETLLMNIMKFAKRTALDHDYVMQEKKQKNV